MADNGLGKKQYNYTYTPNYSSSNFHQNGGEEHDRQAVISSGAYGPDTDWSKYSSAYTTPTKKDTGTDKTATGSTTTSGGYDVNSYLAELAAQRQAAAEAAYEKSMGYLNDAFNNAAENYGNIYNRGREALDSAYNNSLTKINNSGNDAMREAYINKMLSMKNLSQKLAAMGISGGASESTLAGLINNYGNARNNIQRTWDTNKADLETGYGSSLADLYNNYQSQMAALASNRASQAAQLLANLNNQVSSVQSDFYSALAANPQLLQQMASNAVSNVQNIQPQDIEVTNPYSAVNTQQGNDVGGTATNWSQDQWEQANLYNTIQNLVKNYKSNTDIADMLLGYSK